VRGKGQDQSSVIFDYIVQVFETSEYLKRYCPFNVKGNALHVGDKDWRSRVEKVKTGLVGDNARGKGVQDGKGLIVFDEIASFTYPEQVTAAIKPYISPGGGYVLLSSPGEVGCWMHETYLDWKEQERLGSSMHVVFECTWEDIDHIQPEVVAEEKREATAKGRLWEFEREYLGKWTVTDGAFFNAQDVLDCQLTGTLQGSKGDVWIYSLDPGLDRSPSVSPLLTLPDSELVDGERFIVCRPEGRRIQTYGHEDLLAPFFAERQADDGFPFRRDVVVGFASTFGHDSSPLASRIFCLIFCQSGIGVNKQTGGGGNRTLDPCTETALTCSKTGFHKASEMNKSANK